MLKETLLFFFFFSSECPLLFLLLFQVGFSFIILALNNQLFMTQHCSRFKKYAAEGQQKGLEEFFYRTYTFLLVSVFLMYL